MHSTYFPPLLGSFVAFWPIVAIVIQVIVAIFVYTDASHRASVDPTSVKILPAPLWACLSLVGGVPVLALYWAAHHSTLAK